MFFIPVLTVILIFILYFKKSNLKINIVSFLLAIYCAMAIKSVLVYFLRMYPPVFNYSLQSMSYLSICFIIVFSGFTNFSDNKLIKINIDNILFYKLLEIALGIGGIGAIIFFIPHAIKSLKGDVLLNRLRVLEFQNSVLAQYGIINSLFSLFSNLFILTLFFSFIDLIDGKKIRAYILFISSFSYVIYILAYVGRDGVVYWILSFVFVYLFIKDFLAKPLRKKIIRRFLLLTAILLIPFFIISDARFSESEYGTIKEIVNYSGQQIKNFNDIYQLNPPITFGRRAFPLFANWLSALGLINNQEKGFFDSEVFLYEIGMLPSVFKTYIGSFLMDFGKCGTLIILICLAYITRNIIHRVNVTNAIKFSNLVIFILLYQLVLWGVFYNRLYAANLYIICMLLLSVMFKIKGPNRDIMRWEITRSASEDKVFLKTRKNNHKWVCEIYLGKRI